MTRLKSAQLDAIALPRTYTKAPIEVCGYYGAVTGGALLPTIICMQEFPLSNIQLHKRSTESFDS